MAKKIDLAVSGGFMLLIAGIGIITMLWPERVFSQEENRYLKKRPEFSVDALLDGSFGEDYEAALSDQFPGRNHWVTLKVMAERLQGQTSINGVYLGHEEYLIEHFEAEDLLGEQSAKNINSLAAFTEKWQQRLGSDHVRIMMVPSASQIIKDKLPAGAAPYNQQRIKDDLFKTVGRTELFVSVENTLAAHAGEPIYYRTDHHWTSLGAYYAYVQWAQSIGLIPLAEDEFTVKTVSNNFYGTIHSKLNIPVTPDQIQIYEPKEARAYQVYYDLGDTPVDELYSWDALEVRDQYKVFLDGNHAVTRIKNNTLAASGEAGSERRLLMIKDSYAHTFAPFAANHFADTYMIDLRYYNGNISDFIEENGITDILALYQIPGFCTERTISKLK